MSPFDAVHSAGARVEVLDDASRWSYGTLAANFARIQLLVAWYGGDPDRYLEAIARGEEHGGDAAFVQTLKTRLRTEPALLDHMKRLVAEFAERFG